MTSIKIKPRNTIKINTKKDLQTSYTKEMNTSIYHKKTLKEKFG